MNKNLFNLRNTKNIYQQLVLLFILFLSGNAWGQTTVFSDDFGTIQSDTYTTSGVIGTSSWSVNRSGADWGARRSTAGQLDVTNDASATANANGWGFANVALSGFSAPYNTTLSSNTGLVTWIFNFRSNRTSALAGFSATNSYGMAHILAGTSATAATAGTGYAVVMGGGTNNNIALIKYSAGLQGTRTTVIGYGNTPASLTNYISVKVTYNPTDNTWNLYTRDDGNTAFSDPSAGTITQIGTSTVDNTYTSTAMSFSGAYWQGSNSQTQFATFDNYKVTVTPAAVCSGTPAPGNTVASVNPVVSGSTTVLSLQNQTTGSGVTYQWQSSSDGVAFSNISGANSNTYTATITGKTWYQCVVTCSGSSGTSSSVIINVDYCTPTGSLNCTSGDQITNVTINTLNNTTTCGSGGYTLYPATGTQTTNLSQGQTYNLSLSVGTGTGTHGAAVYIDWNQDGDFIDPNEFILISNSITPSTITNVSISVPANAVLGNTRMRVRYSYNQSLTIATSCTVAGTFGETEDYIINVTVPTASTTVTPTSLTGFTATTATDSAQQSFTVSGNTLGSNNITVTPSAGYQISLTNGSGYSSTPIVLTQTSGTVSSTTIYVVLKKSATTGTTNGTITVSTPAVTPDKTVTLTGTITKATFTSVTTGNWEAAATWDLNAIPGAADNVVIATGHTVTATTAQTRDNLTTTVVNGTLATAALYLNNGTTTINGTFQINGGGFGGGTTDFVYGAAGNLIFNHNNGNEYGPIDAGHKYWPGTSGPFNVTINSNSPVNLGIARTVAGTLQVAAGFRNLGNITIGTSGTLRLNAGYSWLNANSSPVYGTSSKLIYNSGGSPARSNEWTASSGTVGTTAGLPQDVQVSNNTTINFPNGSTATGSGTIAAMAAGVVTVDSGSAIYLDYGTNGNSALIVTKDFLLNGNLSLGNAEGGNITVGGNWTQSAAATFTPKGRRVIFNGTVAQTIQKTGGGTIDFDRLEIQKTNATNVALSGSTGNQTSLNLNGTNLNALAITGSGTGSLNLNANTLTFNNDGGDIYVDAAKIILASSGAVVNFNANKKVSNNSGTGSLAFASNATININNSATVDFGKSTNNITTLNGVLNIVGNGSSITPNGPIYATGSKLVYKTGGVYSRRAEWSASSGAGYPYDVQITSNTTLDYPSTGSAAFSTALGIARDLTIDSGSSLYMDYGGGGNKSGSLSVGRHIVNSGNLSLGDFAGGDLSIGGNWTSSGAFIPNTRNVTFNGGDASVFPQKINSATTFDYLTINVPGTNNVELAASIVVNKDLTLANKNIDLKGFNITLPNKSSSITSSPVSYLTATGAGKLIRQNLDGTKDWIFPMGVANAGRYAPITVKNLSGTTDLSVNVNTAITPTVSDATRVLTTKWFVTTTSNVTANIYAEWQGVAAETNSMTIPATGSLATTVGGAPYTFYNVNLVANNTTATGVALSNSAATGIVIGNDSAIKLVNDECSNAVSIAVDAVAVSGTLKGASKSLDPTCGNTLNNIASDVWYKFVTTDAGSYTISVTGSSGVDAVLNLRSGACNGVSIACADASSGGGTETITALLDANTTYYYRIYDYYSTATVYSFTTSVKTVPTIIVTPTTLAYGNVTFNTTSDKTVTVKGSFLNPANGNISVAALSGYEYSLDGVNYSTTLTLPYTSKTLAETTVHVRFSPTTACTEYNGNIAVSGGGATTVNIAVTGKGTIPNPTAIAATDIVTNGFIANWTAVTGATGYLLDISTSPDFGTYSATTTTEGFEAGMPTSGYNTGIYTLSTGDWNLVNALKSTTTGNNYNNTAGGCQLQGSTSASATSPSYNQITSVKFHAKSGTTGTSLAVYKIVGGIETLVQTVSLTTTVAQYTVNFNETASDVKIKFVNGAATSYLDNVIINYSILVPSFVSPYNNYALSGTSQTISGLTTNTTYYYRVRATSGSCQSANSNRIDVTTNNSIIWNNNTWTNTTGPDATLDAIIRTPFYVKASTDEFSVRNLTIENTGLLKIKSGHGITVAGDIITPDDKIIIESDASLTQTKLTNGNSNNKAIAKRNVKMKTLDYTYWSSPLKDQVLLNTTNVNATNSSGGFSPGTPNNRTYEYNEVTDLFRATSNATFIPAKGYAIRGKSGYGNTITVDSLAFSGNLHNGDYPIQIQKSKNTISNNITYEHGYNLIGNPYPSNINFIKLYNLDQGNGVTNSSVIYGKAWFYTNFSASGTQAGSSYGGNNYATITLAGGTSPTSIDSATGTPVPNEFIKVAQGFIVQMRGTPPTGNTPDVATVKFDNSIRTNNATGHFYNNNKNNGDETNRYWLKIVSPYNIANTILIAHMDGATNQYDPDYDAELLTVGDDSFYSKINAQKLQIQARNNPLNIDDAIALGTKYAMDGTYKISLGNREGIFATDQRIYLRDKSTETYTDLTAKDYSFDATKGIDETRFEIVYKNKEVLGTDHLTKSDFEVYRDGDSFVVKSSRVLGKIEIYDVTGKLVQSKLTSNNEVKLDVTALISGVYVIKAENSGNIRTKKIIK